jgi:nitroreductase
MNTIETIRARRSIRKFTQDEIEEEKINLLKEAVLRSPSSRNRNPWKFWFVQNTEIIKKLAQCKTSGSQLLDGAKLAVVIGGDENISDVWIEDCSITAIFVQLVAQSLGLGTCWVQVRGRQAQKGSAQDYVKNLLNIEKNIQIASIIAVGYPDEIRKPLEFGELQFEKIIDL